MHLSALSGADIRQLRVKPDAEVFFTAQENGYTLTIPDIEPSKVQTDLPSLPSGIQFISSKRDEYMDMEGGRGTTIQLWFSFSDTGPVKMPPLIVLINNRTYYIPFEEVTVYENPAVISPELYVEFIDGTQILGKKGHNYINTVAGKPVMFTIYIKYCVQITNFSWDLPLNSIFKEIKRYDITNEIPRGTDFSTQSFPIATFQWTPLVAGQFMLPQVNISATSYSGARKQVNFPEYEVTVAPDESEVTDDSSGTQIYKDAFAPLIDDVEQTAAYTPSREDCKTLAALRCKERNSVFWYSAKKERRNLENRMDFKIHQNEPSLPLFYLMLSVVLLFFLGTVCCLLLKHYRSSVVSIFFMLIFICASVSSGVKLVPRYGIFIGGAVNSIPEEKTSSSHMVSAGLRVRILGQTKDWLYIGTQDADGWVKTDTVYSIR